MTLNLQKIIITKKIILSLVTCLLLVLIVAAGLFYINGRPASAHAPCANSADIAARYQQIASNTAITFNEKADQLNELANDVRAQKNYQTDNVCLLIVGDALVTSQNIEEAQTFIGVNKDVLEAEQYQGVIDLNFGMLKIKLQNVIDYNKPGPNGGVQPIYNLEYN